MFLNYTDIKKPYANSMKFGICVSQHYADNRFFRKVLWIFFL
jgi:hypothetical protein